MDTKIDAPDVTIVGAGVAGMAAALRLLEAGLSVKLIEKHTYVGGKFGANEINGRRHERAYHFLANWCANFWALVERIGLSKEEDFEPRTTYKFLRKGEFPHTTQLTNVASPDYAWDNIFSGVMPRDDMIIFYYSMLDLLTDQRDNISPEGGRSFLNRISINGFMASRDYATDSAALLHDNIMLRAFAIHSYRASARSYRNFLKYAFPAPEPHFHVLKGNTNDRFFRPLFRELERVGQKKSSIAKSNFSFVSGTELKSIETRPGRDGRPLVTGIVLGHPDHSHDDHIEPVRCLLVTVPHGDLARVIQNNDAMIRYPRLANISKLRSAQMASLDLYFNKKLPGLPREHVTLIEPPENKDLDEYTEEGFSSRYSLSFIDNSQLWIERDGKKYPNTFINLVATDYQPLAGLDSIKAKRALITELREYLKTDSGYLFDWNDIDEKLTFFEPYADQPLFMNEVGSWEFRPKVETDIPNFFLAGDYCQSDVDIVCVEGAIYTAYLAVQGIQSRLRKDGIRVVDIPGPKELKDPDWEQIEHYKTLLRPWVEVAMKGSREQLIEKRPVGLRKLVGYDLKTLG